MRILGIVGGIGPESTIDYYRQLITGWKRKTRPESAPPVIINSIDVNRLLALVEAGEFDRVTEYLSREIQRLADAGADFGLLAAGTAHVVFEDLQRRSPIPLVSAVEAAREAAQALGLRRLGLLGTRFTMQGEFYPRVFRKSGLVVVAPSVDEVAAIHTIYVEELLQGVARAESRRRILAIVDAMIQREGIDGVLLGGTELSLLFHDGAVRPVPLLDTTEIHVRAALRMMIPEAPHLSLPGRMAPNA